MKIHSVKIQNFLKFKKLIILSCLFVFMFYIYSIYNPRRDTSIYLEHDKNELTTLGYRANRIDRILYHLRWWIDPSFKYARDMYVSDLKIDIVIPLIEKDMDTAVYTIQSVRKLVMHPIGKIFIVGPNRPKLIEFSKKNDCVFVDEALVIDKFDVVKKYGGWIIQQFIKLSMEKIVEQDHYLVVDADTIFLRPQIFYDNGKYLVNTHWMCTMGRKIFSNNIIKNDKIWLLDFVTHNMLFSKNILSELKKRIENLHAKPWNLAILDQGKNYNIRFFSEYELYMTYLTELSGADYQFVSNANMTVHRNSFFGVDEIIRAYANDYKSISLHHFILRPMIENRSITEGLQKDK
ncbi:MAG: DUF6492 family protein [Gammaproteobacteria bacterium]